MLLPERIADAVAAPHGCDGRTHQRHLETEAALMTKQGRAL